MKAKELRNQVINKLWSYGTLPKKIQTLMTDNEVEFMLEVINVYVAEQLAIDGVIVPKGTLICKECSGTGRDAFSGNSFATACKKCAGSGAN